MISQRRGYADYAYTYTYSYRPEKNRRSENGHTPAHESTESLEPRPTPRSTSR